MEASYKLNTPLAIFLYNRPHLLEQVLIQIRKLNLTTLFVISDGPKPGQPSDVMKVKECRKLIDTLSGVQNIVKVYREANIGIYRNVTEGVEFIFSQTDKCIFVEDDALADISFFRFCDEMLTKYADHQRIMMIQGAPAMDPTTMKRVTLDSYFFSSYPSAAWGWATWGCKWLQFYDGELSNWPQISQEKKWRRVIGKKRDYHYWARKWDEVKATKHTWDVQIMFVFFQYGLLSVVPKENLVKNIGFNQPDATHTTGPSHWERLPLEQISFPLNHPIRLKKNSRYDKLRQNYVAPSVYKRVNLKLKRLLHNTQFKKLR